LALAIAGAVALAACADIQVSEPPPSVDHGGPIAAAAGKTTTTASTSTTTTTTVPTTTTTAPTTTSTTEPPTTESTEAPPPADNTPELRSLAFVNAKRGENGRGHLEMDPALTAAAEGWAAELVRTQELGHNPNLGDDVPDHFHTWGENVAYSSTDSNIDQMWWESEGHRNNILGEGYTSIGIAFVLDNDGLWWAVQVFAG
jgi:uncharacterized protein YkwD